MEYSRIYKISADPFRTSHPWTRTPFHTKILQSRRSGLAALHRFHRLASRWLSASSPFPFARSRESSRGGAAQCVSTCAPRSSDSEGHEIQINRHEISGVGRRGLYADGFCFKVAASNRMVFDRLCVLVREKFRFRMLDNVFRVFDILIYYY